MPRVRHCLRVRTRELSRIGLMDANGSGSGREGPWRYPARACSPPPDVQIPSLEHAPIPFIRSFFCWVLPLRKTVYHRVVKKSFAASWLSPRDFRTQEPVFEHPVNIDALCAIEKVGGFRDHRPGRNHPRFALACECQCALVMLISLAAQRDQRAGVNQNVSWPDWHADTLCSVLRYRPATCWSCHTR